METTQRMAYVFVRDVFAGVLKETDEGYSFQYNKEYLSQSNPQAISLTMPIQEEAYTSKTLFAFFDGLIPEGWLLNVVTHNWKLNPQDRFGVLLVACKDPIGCVSVWEELA